MSFLDHVCVLILTFDEEANLARTLTALSAFREVLVLDSGSTDATAAIAARFANVRFQVRTFDAHATQWNHGLFACGIEAPWVLSLDADYVLAPALVDEIAALTPPQGVSGFRADVRYCVAGRPLSGSLYPSQVVLFRRLSGRYVQQGHTQRLALDSGEIRNLAAPILHDDRKSLARWFVSQARYAALEANYLIATPRAQLRPIGRLRLLLWPAPFVVLVYTLLVKRCLLDGWPGWFYALQRMLAETMIALELLDRRRLRKLEEREP